MIGLTLADGSLAWLFVGGFLMFLIVMVFWGLILQWRLFSKFYGLPGWWGLIPFWSSYQISKKTFGNKYGWIGLTLAILSIPLSNTSNNGQEGTKQAINSVAGTVQLNVSTMWGSLSTASSIIMILLSIAFIVISIWYQWQMLSRLTTSTGLKLLTLFFGVIGWTIILFISKNTKYTGPQPPFKKQPYIEREL